MKKKMTSKLKELYQKDLGLSDAVIDQVSGIAIVGLADDAEDSVIEERAKTFEKMLKAFQSETDRRVNEAVKTAGNKDGKKDDPTKGSADMPDWFKTYTEKQDADRKELLDKISALEGKNAEKTFEELVAKVAGELGLSGKMLDLCKKGLSTDMDEAKIKEEMGATKKLMAEAGAVFEEQLPGAGNIDDESAAREEAKKWVQEHAVK